MANVIISFKIKDESVPVLVEVFGETYQPTITNEQGETIPNPETKAQFAKRTFENEVINHTLYRVVNYRKKQATPIDTTNIIEAT